ncbi:amino acid permease-domain-containing protein [Boeremia exigua]|uniref:amino acid permease-domain-containing protein n=1 Tax=Boeremia exigua TaxID=749465 RepID=UPI001E8DA491|nr:amino acid permease-domain-containing protein [Boeremia exigua]KAH6633472.1 amino acid permease-domain-containing protein [Boeremia exigua]
MVAGFFNGSSQEEAAPVYTANEGAKSDGSLQYVAEKSGNTNEVSYQEASGAPVESESPLGYSVGAITIIFLNLSKMIGTGIYSTPSTILRYTGSIGAAMFYWTSGFFISLSSMGVYLEYAAYFPNRSGSEVAYLEQAYPRPKYFFPIIFAVQSVVLSFSSSNAIVLAQYLFAINGSTPSAWELKGVALASYTVAVLLLSFHTKYSYWLSNGIGMVKLLTLLFISITGLVVLGGNTRVENPTVDFSQPFKGHITPYGATTALYRIIFSYAGFENAFNVTNEIKNPIKTIKKNGFIALLLVAILYILANVAYFAAVPRAELEKAEQIAASLFFQHVFGSGGAVKGLNFLIALSAFGNLLAVLIGSSRQIRECGRQGVLPYPRFWASTRPFGTPLGPYFVKWLLTAVMILAPPAGDAFNFIVDLQVYPASLFNLTLAVGLILVRQRRKRLGLPRPSFRVWDPVLAFNIFTNLYLIVMPWYPPPGGRGNVSFWYGTYIVTGIAILIFCGLYYIGWLYVLPNFRGYRIRQGIITLDSGAKTHKLFKVPVGELSAWDATHDALGRELNDAGSSDQDVQVGESVKDKQ